ncbi:hypothetical protein AK830_g10087 [Neonectria ditissima]|uniref:C2H2-type domain-containing protein n=1 Tax=Neonectria ditissima TaxID=78410 RepID=A0A0P7BB42_9HYPO|nr:hypothetical protein AK830_g10087 [Neonectria ditissima]
MVPTINQIVNAPEKQVRAILLALCEDDSVRHRAGTHYSALQLGASKGKRKAANDLFICLQCDQSFEKEENEHGDCRYHPGEFAFPANADINSDVWADYEPELHGEMDTPEYRESFPEVFTWTCCRWNVSKKGCTQGKHEAHPDRSKRERGDARGEGKDAARSDSSGEEDSEDN